MLGQLAFFAYLAIFYAWPALLSNPEAWNENPLLNQPPVQPGAAIDTFAFGVHAIGAGIIALLGGLQIVPQVRKHFTTFHRWNGRLFVTTVVALSLSGYYIVWVRGPLPDEFSELGTSFNGLLILGFSWMAVRAAMARKFVIHERWAIRLFLVSNAQWFLRIGGFGYFAVMQALGYEVAFDGWFFKTWIWGCFIVPLIIAEIHFRARNTQNIAARRAAMGMWVTCIMLTLLGSAVFSMFMVQLLTGNL
uniref:DUF2306 domain-containing protein n=1 Tax=uncultured Altererythrobacter sp. TaxID=500840 RepID=UPI00260F43A4|nr:DUF2306 domain-containing protein [uncultured Altererythrobacter sp.]